MCKEYTHGNQLNTSYGTRTIGNYNIFEVYKLISVDSIKYEKPNSIRLKIPYLLCISKLLIIHPFCFYFMYEKIHFHIIQHYRTIDILL